MGQRGPLAQPPVRHQRKHVKKDERAKAPVVNLRRPDQPEWLDEPDVVDAWTRFWASDIAGIIRSSDLTVVNRLFRLYQEHAKAFQRYVDRPAVKGSMGQLRTNPFLDVALKLEPQIARLENEIGLNPAARARLGLAGVIRDGVDNRESEDPDDQPVAPTKLRRVK